MTTKTKSESAFTVLELLVVIAVIGLLSSIILAALNSSREKARAGRAAADLRSLTNVLSLYLSDNGVYPCFDHTWDDTREKAWSSPFTQWRKTPWNTFYHWEHGQGFTFSISVQDVPLADAQALDKSIDDNNLSTGAVRGSGNPVRLEYGKVDQSIPFVDCHI